MSETNNLTRSDYFTLAKQVFHCTIRSWSLYFFLGGILVFYPFSPFFALLWGIITGFGILLEVFTDVISDLPDDLEGKLSVALEPTMRKVEDFLEIAEAVADVVQDIQYEVEDEVDEVKEFVDHVHFTIYDRYLRIKYALRDKVKAWLNKEKETK